jgi:adenylate cyclase
MAILATFAFGTCFFLLGALREIVRLPTFLLNLIVQTVLLAVTILIPSIFVMLMAIAIQNHRSLFDKNVVRALLDLFSPAHAMATVQISISGGIALAISGLLSLLINVTFQISRKIGPGMFVNWVSGRYYTPREEERIFMFLDMKDSTAIAERIGNMKFSALVRDFFRDMTYPVLETKGEVSHFIGDEAVLTWKPKEGLEKGNCLQMFFKMRQAVEDRSSYYESHYGFVPDFKAGLHIGRVVATEVGEIKSEIVFHGDVLNTTARIQGLCNSEGEELLISGDLAKRLSSEQRDKLKLLGLRALKGKEHDVEIFALR